MVDQLWPNFEKAVSEAGLPIEQLGTELVLGGWSLKNGRMMATAYAKSDSRRPCVVQPIGGQMASPGEPLQAATPSMAQVDLLAHARLQVSYLNGQLGRKVAGGRALLQRLAAVRGRLSLCADQAAAAKWWLSMPMASVSAEGPMPKALSTRRTSPLMPGCRHQGRACPLRRARMTSNPLIVA